MQYARFGNSGLKVSKFGFGTGSLGVGETLPGLIKNIDQATANEVVSVAIDAGVNLFGTSDKYADGRSEITLGRALGPRRNGVIVASKCRLPVGPTVLDCGLSARYVIQAFEATLRGLGGDWIDIYYAHVPEADAPLEEAARAFEHLVRSGKVRDVAVSTWSARLTERFQGIQERLGGVPVCATQAYYFLVGKCAERDFAPMASAVGLAITVYSPLAEGFLSGKCRRDEAAPPCTRRANFDVAPVIDLARGWPVVEQLRELAQRRRASLVHIALAWVMRKPFVASVLFGISRVGQLHENLRAVALEVSDEDAAASQCCQRTCNLSEPT